LPGTAEGTDIDAEREDGLVLCEDAGEYSVWAEECGDG